MAKGMGNGFPVGGVLIHPGIKAVKGRLGTTFGGNHLACAATLAVLEVLESEQLIPKVGEMEAYLKGSLSIIPGVKEIRGKGLMIGLEMEYPIGSLRRHLLFNEHVFTGNASNPNTLRLLPPLTINPDVIDNFIQRLKSAISHLN